MAGAAGDPRLTEADLLAVLGVGALEIAGRIVDASNVAFLAQAELDGVQVACVYKPTAGERALWDFPDGSLAAREVATYRLSRALGWHLVPETAWRDDGPAGAGMCQRWIDVVPDAAPIDVVPRGAAPQGWLPVVDAYGPQGEPVTLVHADSAALRRLALLDAVVNNADRKGGHVLADTDGAVWGIDHGVTFHAEDKLRTVLWGWAGDPIGDEDAARLAQLDAEGADQGLDDLITGAERRALRGRVARLVRERTYPYPGEGWPALPWPAF